MNTDKAAIEEKINLKEIVDIIVNQYGPVEKIILFGSWARGDSDEYSDIDLIIVKNTNERFIKRLADVPSLPIHADIFVYTPEEFEKMKEDENPFIVSALEQSKIIYSRNQS